MNVYAWVLVGLFAAAALITVATVGKKREPISPGLAAGVVVLDALFVLLVLKAVKVL